MSENKHYCSFCGREKEKTNELIAGNVAFICEECVRICYDMIESAESQTQTEQIPLKKPS